MRMYRDIPYGKLKSQTLDLYLPDSQEFAVFVYFHGGGIEEGDKGDMPNPSYLTERNIAVVSANYRMYPTAVYPEFIRDAAAALAWTFRNIEQYGSCRGIFAGGSSAGAYLSMMLCFDPKYLAPYGLTPESLTGFIHDSGQPTTHFNILRERGLDPRRVMADEAAPVWHIGTTDALPPMLILVADADMENRYEQTILLLSTLKHFGLDEKTELRLMHGGHCEHLSVEDENGDNVFCQIAAAYIRKVISETK